MKSCLNSEDHLFGSTVVGERGQIVIPKEFREKMGLEAGSRLVVMQHGDGPLCLAKEAEMKDFMKAMYNKMNSLSE